MPKATVTSIFNCCRVQIDPIGLEPGPNLYLYASENSLVSIDPKGVEDFLENCKGRYAQCAKTQDPGASTIGNWLRWRLCKKLLILAATKDLRFVATQIEKIV
ncbi:MULTISPECIES: hypothetical protein [Delftia]|uniref:hypothetical protein n=1 Tax=Delftia TaxID=80865 RepID=UPI0012F4F713|nr:MULTISPECIES: hypothetical protein [Delftia]